MRSALPWILVALVLGGWVGSVLFGPDGHEGERGALPASKEGASPEVAALRSELAALRAEVRSLQAAQTRHGPTLAGRAGAAPTPGRAPPHPHSTAFQKRGAASREARLQQEARSKRHAAVRAQYGTWLKAVRSLKDADARETALAEMRAAFDGTDDVARLAALQLARWIGNVPYDHADFRRGILPHARSQDPEIRHAARLALAWVQPEASDVALLAEEARTADRNDAESIAMALTRASGGVIRGETAEAVLHLLRDGTRIKKALVIRGLQSAKEWDPAVEARLIEIVRSVPAHDYDSAYYFHFITPHLDPKSDAVVQLMLDRLAEGKSSPETLVRGFRVGLDDRQKERVADALLDMMENAGTAFTVRSLGEALAYVASARHVERMQALVAGDGVDKAAKAAIERAIDAVRRR